MNTLIKNHYYLRKKYWFHSKIGYENETILQQDNRILTNQ